MNSKWTIGRRLLGCFAGLLGAAAALGYFGFATVRSMDRRIDALVNNSARKVELVNQLNTAESDLLAAQRGLMIYAFARNPEWMERYRAQFIEKAAEIRKDLDEVQPLLVTEEARRYHADLLAQLEAWERVFPGILSLAKDGRTEEMMTAATEKTLPVHEKFTAAAEQFAGLMRSQMRAAAETSQSQSATNALIAVGLILLAVLAAIAGAWVLRATTTELRQIGADLGRGARRVGAASGQVSSASQALAQGASEQAASLEETSASAEEITSMTRKNAENSGAAAGVMEQVDRTVSDANRTLAEMVVSMQEINASSDKIARIIKVIDEIAFQTNILALNAAVEAARAGEAGMGFAVVADEVRNLAQRCAQAAKDTATLIEESISKANEGRAKLEDVNSSIAAITESARTVKTLVDEVNLGSQDQARGIDQIAKAIAQMERVTQKTAASAEESASASEEMSSQARAFQTLVDQLQGMVGAGGEELRVPGHADRPAKTQKPPGRVPPPAARPAPAGKTSGEAPHPATKVEVAPAAAARAEFPLDDDFREF